MNENNIDDYETIGYLVALNEGSPSHGVCCRTCLDKATIMPLNRPTRLAKVNVFPYKQTCHGCDAVLAEGQTEHWPELFPKS